MYVSDNSRYRKHGRMHMQPLPGRPTPAIEVYDNAATSLAVAAITAAKEASEQAMRARRFVKRTALLFSAAGIVELVLHCPAAAAVLILTAAGLQVTLAYELGRAAAACTMAAAPVRQRVNAATLAEVERRLGEDAYHG